MVLATVDAQSICRRVSLYTGVGLSDGLAIYRSFQSTRLAEPARHHWSLTSDTRSPARNIVVRWFGRVLPRSRQSSHNVPASHLKLTKYAVDLGVQRLDAHTSYQVFARPSWCHHSQLGTRHSRRFEARTFLSSAQACICLLPVETRLSRPCVSRFLIAFFDAWFALLPTRYTPLAATGSTQDRVALDKKGQSSSLLGALVSTLP